MSRTTTLRVYSPELRHLRKAHFVLDLDTHSTSHHIDIFAGIPAPRFEVEVWPMTFIVAARSLQSISKSSRHQWRMRAVPIVSIDIDSAIVSTLVG